MAIVAGADSNRLEKLGARLKKIVNCVAIKWWGDYTPIKVSLGSAAVTTGDTPTSILLRAEESSEHSLRAWGTVLECGMERRTKREKIGRLSS